MQSPVPTRRTARDRLIGRMSWGASAGLHACALAGLAFSQPLVFWLFGPPTRPALRTIEVTVRADWNGRPSPDPLLEYAVSQQRRDSVEPQERDADQLGEADRQLDDLRLRPESIVQRRVERAIADARQLDAPEQLDRLRQLSGQLNEVSSEPSLDQLTGQLQRWLGTKARATRPAEGPVAGPFDMTTAQIHDVRREEVNDGEFRYVAILLDDAGRKMETELDESDGAQLYRTFELIKTNPLLEKVYRQVVMSLLDKLTQPAPANPPPGDR